MKKPNFFIIGAPKCGTTSLASWLREHPQVFVTDPKEPLYFNDDFGNQATPTLEKYELLFSDVQSHHVAIGEASTHYLGSKKAVKAILEYSPEAKFIVMLRKPMDMAMSLHAQMCRSNESVSDFEQAWRLQEERTTEKHIPPLSERSDFYQYGDVCRIGTQLQSVKCLIPSEKLLVLFLEDIRNDARIEFDKVLNFLNVSSFHPKEFSKKNVRIRIRSFAFKKTLHFLAGIKRIVGIRFPTGLFVPLHRLNSSKADHCQLSNHLQLELKMCFHQEMKLVEKLVGRTPEEWKE